MPRTNVTAVFVTYGSREDIIAASVRAAVTAGVSRVVVVANGYSVERAHRLKARLVKDGRPLHVVTLPSNEGSAAGFGAGIEAALDDGGEFLWLLDDDNVPDVTALDELCDALAREAVGSEGLANRAWISYRPARDYQRALASGSNAGCAFPSRSAFLYFDVFQRATRRLATCGTSPSSSSLTCIPYGPYGGFFAHCSMFLAIGLPDPKLVLYEDDAEYTNRIERGGGHIHFVATSRIRDIDDNWLSSVREARGPIRLLDAESAVRAYYSVRNRVHFESRYRKTSRAMYLANKSIYLAVLIVFGCRPARWPRLRLLLQAVADGERGHLGVRDDLPLPQ